MKRNLIKNISLSVLIFIAILGIVYLGYKTYFLNIENKTLKSKLEELNNVTISLNEKLKEILILKIKSIQLVKLLGNWKN